MGGAEMTGVILAAGMASRLRPLTTHSPKCLLQVGTRCLLERAMDALVSAGVNEVVIVTGYLHEMIEDFLNARYSGVNLHYVYNADYATTNNIYSLWLTRRYCDGRDILLMDSDILFDPKMIVTMLAQEGNALALNRHECGEEEIKVCIDKDGNITDLSKTCSIAASIGESVGFEKMTPEYTTALYRELEVMIEKEHLDNVFYEVAFERLITQGQQFKVVDTTSIFSIELDTVEDFEQAKKLIPEHIF